MLKISTTTWYVNLYQQTFTAKQIILTTYRQLLHLPVYRHVTCHVLANAHCGLSIVINGMYMQLLGVRRQP